MTSWLFGRKGVEFDAAKDIPDLSGKVIVVTGGNAGLGAESVHQLAQHNPRVLYLTARNPSSADAVVSRAKQSAPDANIKVLQLDLSSLASVKSAAEKLLAEVDRLDILMLNAGIAFTPPGLTAEGYEIQFGVNHMGHALFTKLLVPTLLKTAAEPNSDVRVIALASNGHNNISGIKDLDLEDVCKSEAKSMSTFARYAVSKLSNIYFAKSLARKYPSITAVSLHPGVVGTTVTRGFEASFPTFGKWLVKFIMLFATSVEVGAKGQLWAACCKDKNTLTNGAYYEPLGVEGKQATWSVNRSIFDQEAEQKMWDFTEKELKGKGFGEWP